MSTDQKPSASGHPPCRYWIQGTSDLDWGICSAVVHGPAVCFRPQQHTSCCYQEPSSSAGPEAVTAAPQEQTERPPCPGPASCRYVIEAPTRAAAEAQERIGHLERTNARLRSDLAEQKQKLEARNMDQGEVERLRAIVESEPERFVEHAQKLNQRVAELQAEEQRRASDRAEQVNQWQARLTRAEDRANALGAENTRLRGDLAEAETKKEHFRLQAEKERIISEARGHLLDRAEDAVPAPAPAPVSSERLARAAECRARVLIARAYTAASITQKAQLNAEAAKQWEAAARLWEQP